MVRRRAKSRREAAFLDKQRLDELFAHKFKPSSTQTVLENKQCAANGVIYFTARPEGDGADYQFRAIPDPNNKDNYFIEIEEDGQYITFEVIDLIPDYDMAFLYFPFSETDLGSTDKVQITAISPKLVRKRLEVYKESGRRGSISDSSSYERLEREVSSESVFLKDMDKQYGNLTPKEKKFIPRLNFAVDRSTRLNPMFHHGPDNKSPVSELEDNFPMTVIIPREVGPLVDTYYTLKNEDELTSVLQILKDHGYYVPTNPLWGDVNRVRSDSFSRYEQGLKDSD